MKLIAVASVDKTLRIYSVESGALLRSLAGHTSWVLHCEFSPDDRLVLTSSEDCTTRLWRVDTGEPCTTEMLEKMCGTRSRHEAPKKLNVKTRDTTRSQRMSNSAQALFDDVHMNLCSDHNLPLCFYCVEEKKFLCEECMKAHDETHHTTDGLGLAKMSERALQEVMMNFLQSMNGTDESMDAHLNLLMESRIAARRKVEMTMNTLFDAVAARRKQLLKQVDVAFDQAMMSLRSQHNSYNRDQAAHMNAFATEVTAGMLCDTYLTADTRFTSSKPPLALQPVQVCYFGNTSAQNIAGEIFRMGNVVINTSPPVNFSSSGGQLVKPQAQMAQPVPSHNPKAANVAPSITLGSSSSSSKHKSASVTDQNEASHSQTSNRESESPVSRSSSEPLQSQSPAETENKSTDDVIFSDYRHAI